MASIHEILLRVVGDSHDAEADLNRVARKIVETGTLKAAPEIDLKGVREASVSIAAMRAELAAIDGKTVTAEMRIKIDRAQTSLAVLQRELTVLFNRLATKQRVGLPIDVNETRELTRLLTGLGREAANVGKLMSEAGGGAGNLNQQFSGFLGFVKQINPVLQGMAIIIIAALIPAMLGLASSLIAAAGGFGVLLNALLVSLGPAVLFMIGLFQRFAAIIQALQARKAALNSETRKSAQAQQAENAAAEAERNAHNSVRDAIEQRQAARERLTQAEQEAARQIAAARATDVAAAATLKRALRDAFDAIAQSIRDATTALHSYQSAQLDIEQSKLNTRQARLELRKLRAEMGLTGKDFDSLFQTLTDVDINSGALRAALRAQVQGGKLSSDQALQLEQAHLNVKKAVLGEKEAADRLRQSKVDLNKARRTENEFIRDGIRAYQPYVTAVDAAKKADAAYQRLLAQGVKKNPQVVSARNELRDANQRVTEAQHDLNATLRDNKLATEAATGPLAIYHNLMKKLSPVERAVVAELVGMRKVLRDVFGGGTDAFLAGLLIAFNNLKPVLGTVKDGMTAMGAEWARNVILFSQQLMTPENLANFQSFGLASLQLSDILGGRAFRAFFQIMMNLARIAMPLLIELARDFAGWLEQAAKNTGDVGKSAPIINQMVESFRVWLRFVRAIFGALGALAEVAAPFGDEIVGWLTEAVKGFSKWAKSVKGRNAIRAFFEDTLPLVKEVLTFVGRLVVVFLQGLQLVAPVLAGVLHSINEFLGFLSTILDFINKIASNPWGQAIRFALGQFLGFGVVGRIISGIWKGIGIVREVIGGLGSTTSRVVSFVGGRFSALGGVFGRLSGFARRAVAGAMGWFGSLPGRLAAVLGRVVSTLVGHENPVVRAAGRIAQGVVNVFRGIGNRIKGFFGGIVGVIKGVINAAISVVNSAIRQLNKIHVKIPGWVPKVGGHNFGIKLAEIPTLASGGVPTGPMGALIGDVNEAVLPLQGIVLQNVARAIARELVSALGQITSAQGGAALAGAGGGVSRSTRIDQINLITPEGVPDARAAVTNLAGELGRRGV